MEIKSKYVVILILLMSISGIILEGAVYISDVESLKGIKGFRLHIESLDPEIVRDGLKENVVRNDVELKLRLAGIKILTEFESFLEVGSPYLHVNANILKTRSGSYVYSVEVSTYQAVVLKRNQQHERIAPTWKTGGFGITPDLNDIRSDIKNRVDQFLNAWLSVNPKE